MNNKKITKQDFYDATNFIATGAKYEPHKKFGLSAWCSNADNVAERFYELAQKLADQKIEERLKELTKKTITEKDLERYQKILGKSIYCVEEDGNDKCYIGRLGIKKFIKRILRETIK